MSLKLAVTGADGFVGRHVAAIASERGHDVIAIRRRAGIPIKGAAEELHADLLKSAPPLARVDVVVHLAGLAAVGPSFDKPQMYIDENSSMVINVCEALLRSNSGARVIAVSSGAVYAPSPEPISELAPTSPTSPYVVSKLLVESLIGYYTLRGLSGVVARPFNHIGPGQGAGYIVPDLANQLLSGGTVKVGNLTTMRDYTDVRDVALAYMLLAEAPGLRHHTYNVASGVARTGEEVLSELAGEIGVGAESVERSMPARAIDNPVAVGDASRIRDELGWIPRYSFGDSIRDFVNWRSA